MEPRRSVSLPWSLLAQMEKVVAWQPLNDLIEPVYPKTGPKGGRPPYPLETMLRIHLMQQRFDLSDPAVEGTLVELPTMYFFTEMNWHSSHM
jgi:IS5 family transposase